MILTRHVEPEWQATALYALHSGDGEGFLGSIQVDERGEVTGREWLVFTQELTTLLGESAQEAFMLHLLSNHAEGSTLTDLCDRCAFGIHNR